MGLLSRIENLNAEKKGLLARASELKSSGDGDFCKVLENREDFPAFAEKNGFDRSGVFSPQGDYYFLSETQNLDLNTIVSSLSTKDFWTGLLTEKKGWAVFEGEKLTPLFQFFSEEMKEKIRKISILPVMVAGEVHYFFAINAINEGELSDAALEEQLEPILNRKKNSIGKKLPFDEEKLAEGFSVSSASLFIISAKLSLENAFRDFASPFKELLKKTAINQLYAYLKTLFSFPNCCFSGRDEEIKTVIFSKDETDEKLLQFQLNLSAKKFFSSQNEQNLLVLSAGICPNLRGTVDFLTRD